VILVAFLGNDVMGDDGIGYYLYRYMKDLLPEYARGVFLHTDVLRLPHFYDGEETVVFVDAATGDNYPCGSVFHAPIQKLENVEVHMKHAHLIGAIDSVRLLEKALPELSHARKVFFLIGVNKDNVKASTSLSPCLKSSIHNISAELLKLLHKIHYTC